MMLIVRCPANREPEREYIFHVLLNEFLGISYTVILEERIDVELSMPSVNDCSLRLPDVFLSTPDEKWLTIDSLPRLPLLHLDATEADLGRIPVIYGDGRASESGMLQRSEHSVECGLDIFGSCFFILTRYEEVVLPDRDEHDRFPAQCSIAYQAGFLDVPIVNVYTELLWFLCKSLWPGLERKRRASVKRISHDVDHPFFALRRNIWGILKGSAVEVVKRRDMEAAYRKALMLGGRSLRVKRDPYYTFPWLMEVSERAGLRSSFYFIPEHTDPEYDGQYSLDDPEIEQLMLEIHQRGHEIGLHPSYQTYLSPSRIKHQWGLLKRKVDELGIKQPIWGGRQHFLRWRAPDTWQHWEDAGLNYDSTLGYSNYPGFRCGVCYEYPVFQLAERRMLQLRERPLVIMEKVILHDGGWKGESAFEEIRRYYRECMKYNGEFTLLWHNSFLLHRSDRELFARCLEELT